jgi:hypothetical protein
MCLGVAQRFLRLQCGVRAEPTDCTQTILHWHWQVLTFVQQPTRWQHPVDVGQFVSIAVSLEQNSPHSLLPVN